jgi:hypothetical protein
MITILERCDVYASSERMLRSIALEVMPEKKAR